MIKGQLSLDDFREEVAKRVANHFKGKEWYKGACMDHVDRCYPDLDKAVETSIDDTWYYDGWLTK